MTIRHIYVHDHRAPRKTTKDADVMWAVIIKSESGGPQAKRETVYIRASSAEEAKRQAERGNSGWKAISVTEDRKTTKDDGEWVEVEKSEYDRLSLGSEFFGKVVIGKRGPVTVPGTTYKGYFVQTRSARVSVGPNARDAKLSPEDIAEIKTEKRRKGWSEAQIREYIKELEADQK